jgi:hypothetical protein
MAKAELKTKLTTADPSEWIASLPDEAQRDDCRALVDMMSKITKAPAKLWGSNIIGFGDVKMKYESGRELDWMLCGFSPRKANLTIYLFGDYADHNDLLEKLGKHKLGKACLYLKKLDDVHLPTLKKLITAMVSDLKKKK